MKLLIIRFSSIGDLTQALSIPSFVKSYVPNAEIHFITRSDLAPLISNNPFVTRIWSLNKSEGLSGLFKIIQLLRQENFTHIYDAHNNLRSALIRLFIWKPNQVVRPMMRLKRFLLIRLHLNYFEMPFSGQRDLIKPLQKWNFKYFLPEAPQIFLSLAEKKIAESILETHPDFKNFIVLVPSAAYELKRWPIEFWKKLISINPNKKFIVLAGPTDHFTSELNSFPHVLNLTGKTSLLESAALIEKAQAVITNDTGLLHISEQLGKPTIALMGPAPFGFPSRKSTTILERNLKCRPCSKHGQGPCKNVNYQQCLRSISPEEVTQHLDQIL